MNEMVTRSLQQQLDFETNWQVIESHTKKNFENGEKYIGLIKTPS